MRATSLIVVSVLALAGSSVAAPGQPVSTAPAGYLAPGTYDALKVLPPAPPPGSPQAEADRQIFRATRALKDTPRWSLAQNDVDEKAILSDFSCALGFTPSLRTTPKMVGMLLRLRFDIGAAVNGPKDFYKRPRPYLVDEGAICVDKSDGLAKSPDYPSGHSTWGWAVGLVLAEASPDQASAILARARAFGESRLVCGVHNASSVTAGQVNGGALVATLNSAPLFRSDIEALRKEILAARKAGPAPDKAACAAEAALVAQPLL
ncbi:MAG: phosphatase PAP2 family protein [bacterium]|nr:phosphatase PAP2 family protein [bacterium]